MMECVVMMGWVVGSILHSRCIELFLIPATTGVTNAVVCTVVSVGGCT